jgi:hypothetical protein
MLERWIQDQYAETRRFLLSMTRLAVGCGLPKEQAKAPKPASVPAQAVVRTQGSTSAVPRATVSGVSPRWQKAPAAQVKGFDGPVAPTKLPGAEALPGRRIRPRGLREQFRQVSHQLHREVEGQQALAPPAMIGTSAARHHHHARLRLCLCPGRVAGG